MIPADLISKAQAYVTQLFESSDTSKLHFHNLEHTREVVQHAIEIGSREHVSAEEIQVLQLAAWFHDTGHLTGGIEDHELRSIDQFRQFLSQENSHDDSLESQVAAAIMATKLPHVPVDKLGEIMCDADIYHFGTTEFQTTNKLVKSELQDRGYKSFTTDWQLRSLKLLQDQHFFTPYSRQHLEAGKAENVRWLKNKLTKKAKKNGEKAPDFPAALQEVRLEGLDQQTYRKQEKAEQSLIGRGMQTILRLGSSNHLDLSRMADGKANILISVNSIIISVILSIFIDRLDADPYLTIPTILFLTSSVITVVIAILATRPKLTEGTFTRENIQRKETNLMFFGNFYRSSLEEYTWAMKQMMNDKDYLYDTLVKDIYYLGKVLGRKYKLIRLAYNVFMVGLIVAVVSFSVAIVLNTASSTTTVINANGAPL